ncbi:RNA recognition motif domain-containing protein [Geoalkalibacter sp.]|uniref:RNA recognition motif domain-containing protein n=1 Tax=Geoalkalibacter sp. TaxID=3041440 RepID=UPI00272E6DCE|nr:RNA-binding protein [Geoalkalibacter sp.]
MKPKTDVKEIFVTDIALEASEDDLRKLFSVCGTVRSIHRVNDPQGQFKGVAFVRMANDAQTRDAIQNLDGTRLLNRCIRVRPARAKNESKSPSERPAPKNTRRAGSDKPNKRTR